MVSERPQHNFEPKSQVASHSAKGLTISARLAHETNVHSGHFSTWRHKLLEGETEQFALGVAQIEEA